MSEHYTDEDVDVFCEWLDVGSVVSEEVLDRVAPRIAARALRTLANDLCQRRIRVMDGGTSYIDLLDRADEIEGR